MKNLTLPTLLILFSLSLFSQSLVVSSPDGILKVEVQIENGISWQVHFKGKSDILKANVGLEFGGKDVFGKKPEIDSYTVKENRETITATIPVKSARIEDYCSELVVVLKDDNRLIFRAYNDGVAYRYVTAADGVVEVSSERLEIDFPHGSHCWFAPERSILSHYEQHYTYTRIDTIAAGKFHAMPLLVNTPENIRIWISEAGQDDYPAMFLTANGNNTLSAMFPKFVLQTEPNEKRSPDRNEILIKEADYIARTEGGRSFPWRVFVISDDDSKLASSNLVYQLSSPCAIHKTDWIKPGKVAWDWYNANIIWGVDFESGLNTATYKYYIDFAAKYNIEYVILDEGWSLTTMNILGFNPEIDVHELIRYGKSKNVGIILWVLWKPLITDLGKILKTYADWGAAGVKVDFMQRADQQMVNYYEEIAHVAAQNHLLVDFHGSFKPNGLHRKYPNVLSYEGVRGNENNKWSDQVTPEHNLTLPFTRMLAGPMDYTPGAMRNANKKNFAISFERPMSLGTRCHQLAMYVVYESPLQMLCDSPSSYQADPEIPAFLSQIPTVWDETIVLDACVANYILTARRRDDKWYLGGMTDFTPRTMEIDFSFLPDGNFRMELMRDGANADRFAEDYRREILNVNKQSRLNVSLASGGGFAAILVKE